MTPSDLYTSVIIVAAGRGTRMEMDKNKQYIEVCGVPILARTLQCFENCRLIDEIILVVNEHDIFYCKQNIVDEYGFKKVKTIAAGGKERQDSVFNGLREVSSGTDIVLIHDGARPFVTEESIAGSVYAALEYGASCAAVPVKDTIKQADENGFIDKTLERQLLWSIQTPQTFRYGLIMEAHGKALKSGFRGTDDAVLVELLGTRVRLVMGSYNNIKITTREDLTLAEHIVKAVYS